MPDYLRHPRGFGKLFDDAEANASTFIDRTSSASGSAKLRDCKLLEGSSAEDRCQVYGGEFFESLIKGDQIVAGSPRVNKSTLWCSEVSGSPIILDSVLIGSTEVCDSPSIVGARLVNATVYGSPKIVYPEGDITGRVHEGIWTRPPKHIKLPWCDLSECVVKNGEQHVLLDCRCRSVSYWMKHGPKLARRWGWNQDQIDVTISTIQKEFASVDLGDGWFQRGDIVSKYEDNTLTTCNLADFRPIKI